jgi:hypothetical protein
MSEAHLPYVVILIITEKATAENDGCVIVRDRCQAVDRNRCGRKATGNLGYYQLIQYFGNNRAP